MVGCRKVILKVDSEVVVKWIQEETVPKVLMADLIHMCKNKVYKQWKVSFKHIYRETNRAADMLAKAALQRDLDFHIIEEIPP